MINPKDPLVWAARRLQGALSRADEQHDVAHDHLAYAARNLLLQQEGLEQTWRLLEKARQRGWSLTVNRLRHRLFDEAQYLRSPIEAVLRYDRPASAPPPPRPRSPCWRELLAELRQLGDEFEQLAVEPRRGMIAVTTDAITLQHRYLGPFRIELHFDRLAERGDVSAFDCVALDPHPASANEDTTHPHVRDGAPCAGEATAAVAEALRGGRVADAFVLIDSVLHTYNPQSPYIALEEWDGVACADCGAATDPDEMYRCEDCEAECCEGCIRYCHACERNCCAGCVEHDAGGDRRLCAACRAHCSTCGDVTAQADVDEAGRCPSCAEVRDEVEVDPAHENQLLPHEQETEHDSNQRESEREHPHAGDVSEVPVPAAP